MQKTQENKKPSMQKIIVGLIIAALVLYGIYYFAYKSPNILSGNSDSSIDKVALAKFLTEKGAKMYGAYWCPHCQNQKKEFGDGVQFVPYVECSPEGGGQNPDCVAAGINGYPTWVFPDGSRLEGEVSLNELAAKIGYTQN